MNRCGWGGDSSFCLVNEMGWFLLIMKWFSRCMFIRVSVCCSLLVMWVLVLEGFGLLEGWLWLRIIVVVLCSRVCCIILWG